MDSIIDFRNIDRNFRHAIFFSILEGLKEGSSFEFLNDHAPVPLHKQLLALGISNIDWTYCEEGPQTWRIRITKKPLGKEQKEEGCCGTCGDESREK